MSIDPTRTGSIRRKALVRVVSHYFALQRSINRLVVAEDAFGLEGTPSLLNQLTSNGRFSFVSDPDKVKAFQEWLQANVDAGLLSGDSSGKPWLSEFIESAYKKAVVNAYVQAAGNKLLRSAGFVEGSKAEFLRSTFGSAQTTNRLQMLFTRAFEQLKGITAQMSGNMARVLTDGLANGKGAREVARTLTREVGINRARAQTLARTELIHAYSEGSLDSYQALGIEEVGVLSEWLTAGDDRVCPRCQAQEGKRFTIAEARGLIPFHPNCRCAFIPYVPLTKEMKASIAKGRKESRIPSTIVDDISEEFGG